MLNFSEFGEAKEVFYYFNEISKIPHGSGNTQKIADFLVNFANERGLYVRRDEADNVVIKKRAFEGYEDRPTVILQGHTDMVEAVAPEINKDMKTEGLDLYVDGDFLKAKGTTLGGDDGIAVAYALALLDSKDIPHPALEVIFTSDEEIGLLGAVALDTNDINGRLMINIDSDSEGLFIVGCAGGVRIDVKHPMNTDSAKENGLKIRLDGLKGGHSGVEIGKGRENAIKLLAELLSNVTKDGEAIRICAFNGGNADNAIPRYAECVVESAFAKAVIKEAENIKKKYAQNEPEMTFTFEEVGGVNYYDAESSRSLISLINEEPSGVIAMSEDIKGLIETSLNLGIARCDDECATITFSVRSAKRVKKEELATRVTKIAAEYGATSSLHGDYPSWEYRKSSHLCDVMCEVYRKMQKKEAKVITIHAGLECGIFSDKLPGLDCVSFGPDNHDIHTTEERLSIPSTIRVWQFLKEVLINV